MAAIGLFILLIYVFILIVSLGLAVLQIIATWKLYEKAGVPGWSAIVPVYNYMQMIKIALGSYKLAWVYLAVTGVSVILSIIASVFGIMSERSGEYTMFLVIFMCFAYLMMIPLYAIASYTGYMFAKSFGKSTTFCVLSIFFSQITILIMAFDKKTVYVGPKGIPQYNTFYGGNYYQ